MPYTWLDRVVFAVVENRLVNRAWLAFGAPPISIRMLNRRLPNGQVGFRVITLKLAD